VGWISILSENFSGYANITDLANAYLHPDGSATSLAAHGVTIGPTIGPDGGPGVVDNNTTSSQGQLRAWPRNCPCRGIRIKVRVDLTNWATGPCQFFGIWWAQSLTPGEFDGSTHLVSLLGVRTGSGSHGITATAEDMDGTDYNSGQQNVLPRTGVFDLMIEIWRSTITGSVGAWSAASDGSIAVLVDGSVVWSVSGIQIAYGANDVVDWNSDPLDNNPSPYVNLIQLGITGSMTNWEAWRSDECDAAIPPAGDQNLSNPCCADGGDPSTGPGSPGDVLPPNSEIVFPGYSSPCTGLGLVPTAADPTDPESWLHV
jgi:hypothetical protein